MKKVYCGQCVYYKCGFSDRDYEHCSHPDNQWEEVVESYLSKMTVIRALQPSEKNQFNNCSDFSELEVRV